MKASLTKKYFGIALFLSMVICISIDFPLIVAIFFEDNDWHRWDNFDIRLAGIEFFNTFLVAFLMFTLNYYVLKPFSRHQKMNLKTILLSVLLTLLSVFVLIHIFNNINHFIGFEPKSRGHHGEVLFRNFFCSALVLGSIFIMRLIFQKQSYELENEQLRTESLQSQFESLKNQMSPHFLFNTLTALNSLIRESPDVAEQYVNHLAQVLRYTLQGNEKKTISLREEMEFTESYLFLIKMRYGTNLIVNTDIRESFMNMELPPLTIQTLLENAVKHNEISNRKPLTISIQTSENANLVVSNQVQKKLTQEQGTGIGLTNLSKQFQLLGERDIQIIQEDNEFRIIIPLIKPVIL